MEEKSNEGEIYMADLKCKVCGGTFKMDDKENIARCQECGALLSINYIDESLMLQKNEKPRRYTKLVVGIIAIITAIALLLTNVLVKNYKRSEMEYYLNRYKNSISAGWAHIVGLKSDGTVMATGWNDFGQCDVYDWEDIVAVSAGYDHTVGLKSDGTVVAVGDNSDTACNVEDWTDIIAISAGAGHTVGLKPNGKVVATGWNEFGQCEVYDWDGIVAISAGSGFTAGLRSDGTIVTAGRHHDNPVDIISRKDIVSISAGRHYVLCLKSDGTVITGDEENDYSDWKDIIYLESDGVEAGLKSNGTVVTSYNGDSAAGVDKWKDIVSFSIGYKNTVGLKSDGTVVVAGDNRYGQHYANNWDLF